MRCIPHLRLTAAHLINNYVHGKIWLAYAFHSNLFWIWTVCVGEVKQFLTLTSKQCLWLRCENSEWDVHDHFAFQNFCFCAALFQRAIQNKPVFLVPILSMTSSNPHLTEKEERKNENVRHFLTNAPILS